MKSSGRNERVAVVGIVRNNSSTLSKTLASLERGLNPIGIAQTFVVESDSSDETVRELQRLQANYRNFSFISLGRLRDALPDRLARLAVCREEYRIRFNNENSDTGHVIVVDFDGITSSIKRGELFHALKISQSWDVLAASCTGPYYDLLALRKPGLIETDYRDDEQRVLEQSGNPFRAKFEGLVKRQKSIPRRRDPIEVESAFGGLAIYKSECFAESSYLGADSENVCEHVTFHTGLRQRGRRIAILPSLRVRPEVRHQIFAYRIWWPVWWVLSNLPGAAARPLARVLSLRVGRNK